MELLSYEQAKEIRLPLNPLKRRQAVAEQIADMSLPGVSISPEPFLKGRGDLVRHVVGMHTAIETMEDELYDEETVVCIGFDSSVGFETMMGMRTTATIIINKGEVRTNGQDI